MYKFVTVLQIAFSGVSLLVICIMLPIMYNNVQTTISYVEKEMTFCEVSTFLTYVAPSHLCVLIPDV